MDLLGNIFVKKALKSMLTEEQISLLEKISTAVQSGKIDRVKLRRIGEKFSKMSIDEVNKLVDLIDKNI